MQVNLYSFVSALSAVLPFAPKNDVRYYLNGVHLVSCEGGFYVEATDGHTAVRVKIDTTEPVADLDLVIPHDVCAKVSAFKVAKKYRKEKVISFEWHGLGGSFSDGQSSVSFEAIEGKYVDLGRVMRAPAADASRPSDRGVSALYLARVGKSAAILANPKYHGVAMVGAHGASDNFIFKVPTDHGDFLQISEPALFVICPIKL